ncbi:MAG: PEP/pyruvate-binding domain-containing protein, partial [Thermoanaerobaculales bacterium]|nr:PEP/pyruvate-binding domain-containing protein [Thermoanaerobaculales bacterium]
MCVKTFGRTPGKDAPPITRIGGGALGGKASGLRLIQEEIIPRLELEDFPGFDISVPRMVVLATDVFDRFMEDNRLWGVVRSAPTDDRLTHAFLRAELPLEVVGDLRALIDDMRIPLAVRSSSRLEDDLDHPFAGVYGTKMIPNNEFSADDRFRSLTRAVQFVWASTFFASARSAVAATGKAPEDEGMAVILQEVVGQRAGDRFYPCLSGVGRTYNFYPTGAAQASDGVVNLALGLGRTIVDGGRSWSFSPALPKAPPPFNSISDLLKNTQTRFWAVNMGPPALPDPLRETEFMVEAGLAEAESDDALRLLVSTYDAGSDRLDPGLGRHGPRALTFAPLVGSRLIPFNDLLRHILDVSRKVMGGDVEIEFAIRLDRQHGLPAQIGFLQVRPMRVMTEEVEVAEVLLGDHRTVIASTHVLGNGVREDIQDIVFLDPDLFDQDKTFEIAAELEALNRELVEEGRPYILIGFGRWGTSDVRLGIPVTWGQISGAKVIVEA